MNETSKQFVVVMRHGERADSVEGTSQKFHIHDPELTIKGHSQANSIAHQLKKFFSDIFDSSKATVKVISSPFARTLQTAKNIVIGLPNPQKQIFIDNGLSEYIKKEGFNSNPTEFLEWTKQNPDLFEEFKEFSIFLEESSPDLPTYPELFQNCLKRYRETLSRIIEKQLIQEKIDIVIIVTHGYGVQIMSESMNVSEEVYEYDFCCTQVFRFNNITKQFSYLKELKPTDE